MRPHLAISKSLFRVWRCQTPCSCLNVRSQHFGDVAALVRSRMNGLQPFENTTEQTTETMPPSNKTITAAAMRTNRITSSRELLRKRAFLFYRLLKWCRLFLWQMFRSNANFCYHFEFSLAFRLFASKKWIDCVQLFQNFLIKRDWSVVICQLMVFSFRKRCYGFYFC